MIVLRFLSAVSSSAMEAQCSFLLNKCLKLFKGPSLENMCEGFYTLKALLSLG